MARKLIDLLPLRDSLRLFFTGFAMGSADIVPGVSGGTMAFIFGVYEELVFSIKKMSGEILGLVLRGKIKKAIIETPISFLLPLGLGLLTALATLSTVISHYLETQPTLVWSFFFGLLVASILIVRKRVVTWDTHDVVALLVAAVVAFFIVGLVPVETSENLLAFFLAGSLAIVAMILPGVSGSFLLILMGKYEQVLEAVLARDFLVLGAVFLGALVGLALFSRVLTWLFEEHHDIAVAALTGFMVGSLRKVWPWKEVDVNVLPSVDNGLYASVFLMGLAFFIMFYLDSLGATAEEVEDVGDTEFEREHKEAVKSQKKHKV